jgi:hypothetical protein
LKAKEGEEIRHDRDSNEGEEGGLGRGLEGRGRRGKREKEKGDSRRKGAMK